MKTTKIACALLAGTSLMMASGALAQTVPPTTVQPEAVPDQSDAAADAAIAAAGAGDDGQAKIELLTQQVEALQAQLENIKSAMVKVTPSWKGGPLYEDKEAGWSFKPKGTLQFDVGYVGFPNGQQLFGSSGGLDYNRLGFNTRARRAIIGAEGSLPGGFGYNVEFNFAQGTVDYEDVLLSYQRKGSPIKVQIGNFYPMSSMETMNSSKFTSFMERPAFTDAFNYNRRLGVSVALLDPKQDRFSLTGGIFSQEINTSTNPARTGWEAGARGTFSPKMGTTQLHFGISAHHRVNQRDAQGQQYRARPELQTTDQRFVDAGTISSDGDDSVGLEFAAVHKSLHFAAEAQKLWVRGFTATEAANVALHPNNFASGTAYVGDPSFEGGYAELGYFLTGETRGYKGGKFDRTKVLHPFDQGGWGALQINGRVDYINLNDRVGDAPTGSTPAQNVAAPYYVNGGKQVAYIVGLVWSPMDYVRFTAQYAHLNVTGGPRATVNTVAVGNPNGIFPIGTTTLANDRKYSVDTAGLRAQIDF
ncbi:MAG: porin [Sphingomicrobium sp.]